jgi:hypothetical protein
MTYLYRGGVTSELPVICPEPGSQLPVLDKRIGDCALIENRRVSGWVKRSSSRIVSLPAAQSKELISRKAAIRNSVTCLLTNHSRTVMVCV